MFRTIVTSVAALAATVNAAGSAIVINKCNYNAYMSNTPASGGGYSNVDQTLSSGATYTQAWTELSNGMGWSIKLSKTAGAFQDNILQYEYTFHNDGTIWYDLSEVDGNPWDANWEITATNGCTPRQAAYRYSTDDAYGMQSCADDATITVILCSGDAGDGSSSPATTGWTTAAPVPTTTTKPHTHTKGHHTWGLAENKVAAPVGDAIVDPAPAPVAESSTLATVVGHNGAVTVTNVHIETLTKYVTATAAPAPKKRHEHHARHLHNRR